MDTRDVPKSLHTLTVLQQVACHVAREAALQAENMTLETALDEAMDLLGLAGRPDPHGLRAKALARLVAQ